jgi:beta-glucosidase
MNAFTRRSPLALIALAATTTIFSHAQAPHPLTPAEEAHVDSLIHAMTLEQKLDYIGGTGFAVRAVPSLNLPALEMSDGPYGTRSNAGFPSTTYAAGIGLAASWDRELAAKVGAGIGRDARARGVHFMLGPGVNIYRSPRNGRNFEYFGEDPYLTSQIAVGYITGMQQQGVSSTIKHYILNNSEYLRHDSNSVVDERALREIYLPSFEAAIKTAHVGALMDSYNLVDGLHATQNPFINIEVIRKEYGFKGVLMSDWDATYDGVAAANAGLDIEMPTGKFMNQKTLLPAIKAGTVSEATIDLKIKHILDTAESFGWLDAGHQQRSLDISTDDAANNEVALQSAREGAVLLKNEGNILPLDKSHVKTILLVGPDAYPGVPVGGGSAGVVPFHLVSDLEGLTTVLGTDTTVLYDRGLPTLQHLTYATDFTTAAGGQKGVTLESFPNKDLQGTPASQVVQHITLEGLNFKMLLDNLDALMPQLMAASEKTVSHRFTGFYTAAKAGDYIVALEDSGEGSGNRVYVDGKLLFDNWTLVKAFQPTATIPLSAGPHKIVVEEWQGNIIGGHILFAITPADSIVDPHAIELARHADAVVIAAGFQQDSESEGGDRTFSLPFGQDQLITAIAAANPKTIVTVTSGGNVDSTQWIDKVPALLETWYAGQAGGTALAEILTGQVNPSGHLPATFERRAEDNPTFDNYYPAPGTKTVTYKEGIFVGYRGYEHNHTKPLFPFGFGLSYTTFSFANLKVVPEFNSAEPHVDVFFDVTNTGSREGAEVAQVYVGEDHPAVERPAHELKNFARVELAPNETKHVTLSLDPRAFSYWDTASKSWKIDAGRFTISVGDNVENLPLTAPVESPK